MQKKYRKLLPREAKILENFLALDFPGAKELREQLKSATVCTIVEDKDNYGSLEIVTNEKSIARVDQRVPAEARAYDTDGIPIDALIHVSDGKLCELEFYKIDGTPIKNYPDPDNFKYSVRD